MPKLNQRGAIQFLILFLLLAGIVGGVFLVTSGNPLKIFSRAFERDESVESLTAKLLELNKPSGRRSAQSAGDMIEIAAKRQTKLLAEIATSPNDFLEDAILFNQRDKFPEAIRPFLESEKEANGEINIIHADDFTGRKILNEYKFKTEGGSEYQLYFTKSRPAVTSGSKVSLKGIELGGSMALHSDKSTDKYALRVRQAASVASLDSQKTAVVLVNIDSTELPNSSAKSSGSSRQAAGGGNTIQVFSPSEGETFTGGQTMHINWSANWPVPIDPAYNHFIISIYNSTLTDGYQIKVVDSQDIRSYDWEVEVPESFYNQYKNDKFKIIVAGFDSDDPRDHNWIYATSGLFDLDINNFPTPTPSPTPDPDFIRITSPIDGQAFNYGDTINFTWDSSDNIPGFAIYFRQSGVLYNLVNGPINLHSYQWKVAPIQNYSPTGDIEVHMGGTAIHSDGSSRSLNSQTITINIGPVPTPTPVPVLAHLTVPITTSDAQGLLTSLSNYYSENSNGRLTINGEIFETTITTSTTSCEYAKWGDLANQSLADKDIANKYQKVIYVFPDMMDICKPYGALGTLGGSPGKAWIWSDQTDVKIYLHEFGHTLGADHANLVSCGSKAIDEYSKCVDFNPYPDIKQEFGRGIEYGEKYDVMGTFYNGDGTKVEGNFLFNGPQKSQLGWIPGGSVVQVGSNRVQVIKPPTEFPGNGRDIQILKISKKDTQEHYFISYRKAVGSDSKLPSGMTSGAIIHISKDEKVPGEYYPTKLIDTTPNIPGEEALSDGRSFYDQINKILIRQISHNDDSVTIEVKFDQTEAPPPPTPAPARMEIPPPPAISKDSPQVFLSIPSEVKVNQQVVPTGSISSTMGINRVWSYVAKDGGSKPVRVTADDVINFNQNNFKCTNTSSDDCNWYLISLSYGSPFSTVFTPKTAGVYKVMVEVEPNTVEAKAHYCSSNPYVSYPLAREGILYYRCGDVATVQVNN